MLCNYFIFSYQRHESEAIGKFCLNLTRCPKDSTFTDHLYHLIENIVIKVLYNNSIRIIFVILIWP